MFFYRSRHLQSAINFLKDFDFTWITFAFCDHACTNKFFIRFELRNKFCFRVFSFLVNIFLKLLVIFYLLLAVAQLTSTMSFMMTSSLLYKVKQ